MTFVKVYQYHVQKEKVAEFLRMQTEAAELYRRYIESKTFYLNSRDDETKWLELTCYEDEEDFNKSMGLINKQKELQELFRQFETLLVKKQEVSEEDFILMRGDSCGKE